MKFEWDIRKEKINIKKHGISFEQASFVFSDPFSLSRFDDEHSNVEDRFIILGKSLNESIAVVAHTFRNHNGVEIVRIISARKATKKEHSVYKERC